MSNNLKKHTVKTPFGSCAVWCKPHIRVCGELEWKLVFRAAQDFEAGFQIRVKVPAYQHQRSEEYLQNFDYWKPNYIYAYANEERIKVETHIEKINSAFKHVLSWPDSKRICLAHVFSPLKKGDSITLHFGGSNKLFIDGEGVPSRVSQFANKVDGTFLYFETAIRKNDCENFTQVEVFPLIQIIPDRASRLHIYAPVITGTAAFVEASILVSDRFNNPIFNYDTSKITLFAVNLKTANFLIGERCGEKWRFMFTEEGFYHIIEKNMLLETEHAPVLVKNGAEALFFGDTHVHSNLTANIRDNDGGAFPQQCYEYSKQVTKLDFVCLVEQTDEFNGKNDVNIDEKTWGAIPYHADSFNKDGEFAVISGFEIHEKRGDTVCLFKDSLANYAYPRGVQSIGGVWEHFKTAEILTVPHLHKYCNGRPHLAGQGYEEKGFEPENWKSLCEKERLCEIFSSQWGCFESHSVPMILKARANVTGNTIREFLNAGKQWGFTASSDGHDGNPGYGGITGVFASSLTRSSIFAGLKERKALASTHPRFAALFSVNGCETGSINALQKGRQTVSLVAVCPHRIVKIEFVMNGKIIRCERPIKAYAEILFTLNCEDFFYIYPKLTIENGHLLWASPVFFTR